MDDKVANEEILYRRVPIHINGIVKFQSDGTLEVSSQAFNEPNFRPSVDRAKLRENDPRKTLAGQIGGVVSFIAINVRSINDVALYNKQEVIQIYKVDIEPSPILNDSNEVDNPAHAEIYLDPVCTKKAFKRLCERLAILANNRPWEIMPPLPKTDE